MRRFLTTPVSTITAVGVFIWALWCDTLVDSAQRDPERGQVIVALFLVVPLAYGIVRLLVAPLNGATKASAAFVVFLGVVLLLIEVVGPFTIGVERWSQVIGTLAALACLRFGWRNHHLLRAEA